MQRKSEKRSSSSSSLHATPSSSDFDFISPFTALFLNHLLEDSSLLPSSPKWLCQNGGNRKHLLSFLHLLFYIYTLSIYTCPRFNSFSALHYKVPNMVVTSHNNIQPSCRFWLERRDLPLVRWKNNDYLMITPRLYLMGLQQRHHSLI